MNFKPNILKIITSLILGIVGGYYSLYIVKSGEAVNQLPRFILPFLAIFILIYLSWSLIQGKR